MDSALQHFKLDAPFAEYNYDRKAAVNTSITDWYNTRLKPIWGDYDAEIIDSYGTNFHGRTKLEKVWDSYAENNVL